MLAESLAKARITPQTPCAVRAWVESLDVVDRSAVKEALLDSSFSSASLLRLFKEEGAPFAITTLKIHRYGECSCL